MPDTVRLSPWTLISSDRGPMSRRFIVLSKQVRPHRRCSTYAGSLYDPALPAVYLLRVNGEGRTAGRFSRANGICACDVHIQCLANVTTDRCVRLRRGADDDAARIVPLERDTLRD